MALDPPSLVDFRARYPAFAAVTDATVTYWLQDATRFVDESWPITTDQNPAMLAYAAHSMTEKGIGGSGASAALATGLTRWRSASADLQFSEAAAAQAAEGGLEADVYGREYLALLRRNKGGPMVTDPGHVPHRYCWPYPYGGFYG